MSRVIDERLAYDIDLESFSQKPNVKRTTGVGEDEVVTYVVLVTLVYWLLDENGRRLKRQPKRHELYPLANPITGLQFINNLSVLSPLIRAAAIADRNELCGLD